MTDLAGRLQIRIGPGGTTIASSRPLGAANVFVGRGPEETARLLPALFSICSTAQSAACVGALEQAQGLAPAPSRLQLRQRLVDAETLREHLWRILLDWPRVLGLEPDAPAMARVLDGYGRLRSALASGLDPFELGMIAPVREPVPRSALESAAALKALVAERVLGVAPARWLASVPDLDALAAWCGRMDTVVTRLLSRLLDQDLADLGRSAFSALPELVQSELDGYLAGPGAKAFIARPTWDGEPRETSPLTRSLDAPLIRNLVARFGNGILTRLVAQLVEVARIASGADGAGAAEAAEDLPPVLGESAGLRLEPGVGLARVTAARGLLVHRVRVAEGRVADYRILAPTEWNFNPRGAVAAGLDAIAARLDGAEIEPLARLFIAAVDPCVDFDLIQT